MGAPSPAAASSSLCLYSVVSKLVLNSALPHHHTFPHRTITSSYPSSQSNPPFAYPRNSNKSY
eukprot:scaffold91020_cov46-Attheya_sp.AAC.1